MNTDHKIGVGLIGVGGWAKYGHLPALQTLDAFEVVGVSSRRMHTAKELAAEYGIARAYDDYEALIADVDVDLVVIPAPAPEHARLVKAAIAGGKDVYSEWPLTTNTVDSEELLALAEAKGVRHIVGLQRRFAPSARYWHDLVRQGHVGEVRGVHMSVGVDAFQPRMPEKHAWVLDPANFVHLLPVYFGHFGDLLFHGVGYPSKLTAVSANQFPCVTIVETALQVPYPIPTEVMAIGTLERGGLFSIQLEGGQRHPTGVEIVITGTEGALRVTNRRGFENEDDNTIEGMTGGALSWTPLPIPTEYESLPKDHLVTSVKDVAYLYVAYANDKVNGTSEASDFKDAVRLHQLLDRISESSASFDEGADNGRGV